MQKTAGHPPTGREDGPWITETSRTSAELRPGARDKEAPPCVSTDSQPPSGWRSCSLEPRTPGQPPQCLTRPCGALSCPPTAPRQPAPPSGPPARRPACPTGPRPPPPPPNDSPPH